MNLDTRVLCAMYRLSACRRTVTESDVAAHARRSRPDVVEALGRLGRAGLVELRAAETYRLTMSGLVIAVAVARARQAPRSGRETISHAA